MANTNTKGQKKRPTPEKRDKINAVRAARNRATRSELKTAVKKANVVGGKDKVAVVRYAIKRVDQACAKGLMHKNCAARKKSQLMKLLNA